MPWTEEASLPTRMIYMALLGEQKSRSCDGVTGYAVTRYYWKATNHKKWFHFVELIVLGFLLAVMLKRCWYRLYF